MLQLFYVLKIEFYCKFSNTFIGFWHKFIRMQCISYLEHSITHNVANFYWNHYWVIYLSNSNSFKRKQQLYIRCSWLCFENYQFVIIVQCTNARIYHEETQPDNWDLGFPTCLSLLPQTVYFSLCCAWRHCGSYGAPVRCSIFLALVVVARSSNRVFVWCCHVRSEKKRHC